MYTYTNTSGTTSGTVFPIAYNGDLNYNGLNYQINGVTYSSDPSLNFLTVEERLEYQQQAYLEPRDHAFNPSDDVAFFYDGVCQDCAKHNIYRTQPDKHLYVIDEEEDWLLRLAS